MPEVSCAREIEASCMTFRVSALQCDRNLKETTDPPTTCRIGAKIQGLTTSSVILPSGAPCFGHYPTAPVEVTDAHPGLELQCLQGRPCPYPLQTAVGDPVEESIDARPSLTAVNPASPSVPSDASSRPLGSARREPLQNSSLHLKQVTGAVAQTKNLYVMALQFRFKAVSSRILRTSK